MVLLLLVLLLQIVLVVVVQILQDVSGPEVYGFTGIGSNLQVRTTNGGADNITGAQYDAFEQVLFAPSGITFSINSSGNLIATFDDMATIDLGKIKQVFRGTYNNATVMRS